MKLIQATLFGAAMALASVPAIAGDAAAGEATFNAKGCTGCHGAGGKSTNPAYPVLAGQDAKSISDKLTGYKTGTLKNATMNAMAAMLSDADISNVAAYLSAQK